MPLTPWGTKRREKKTGKSSASSEHMFSDGSSSNGNNCFGLAKDNTFLVELRKTDTERERAEEVKQNIGWNALHSSKSRNSRAKDGWLQTTFRPCGRLWLSLAHPIRVWLIFVFHFFLFLPLRSRTKRTEKWIFTCTRLFMLLLCFVLLLLSLRSFLFFRRSCAVFRLLFSPWIDRMYRSMHIGIAFLSRFRFSPLGSRRPEIQCEFVWLHCRCQPNGKYSLHVMITSINGCYTISRILIWMGTDRDVEK